MASGRAGSKPRGASGIRRRGLGCLYSSRNPPHSPYAEVPEKYRSLYDEIWLRPNVCAEGLHHHTGEQVPCTEEELLEATKQYYGAISGLDDQFGRLIGELKRLGIYEDTVMVLSADHGDMMGSHGLMGKHVWYDESVKIPLAVRSPGSAPRICETCIGSQDMMPTVLGILGVPIPETVEGQDCSVTMEGKDDFDKACCLCACPGRSEFSEAYKMAGMNPMKAGWRGVRTRRYTYVIDSGYEVEPIEERHLYDNCSDMYQRRELDLDIPENREVAIELENRLVSWMRECKDDFRLLKEG